MTKVGGALGGPRWEGHWEDQGGRGSECICTVQIYNAYDTNMTGLICEIEQGPAKVTLVDYKFYLHIFTTVQHFRFRFPMHVSPPFPSAKIHFGVTALDGHDTYLQI